MSFDCSKDFCRNVATVSNPLNLEPVIFNSVPNMTLFVQITLKACFFKIRYARNYTMTSVKQYTCDLYSSDDFRKEDIAAALLQTTCTDISQVLEMLHQRVKFKRVFWCGSFIKAEVVRRYLTLEWRRRAVMSTMMSFAVSV